jgi:Fic family protein
MIHPFLDGNGRVGREIFNYMLSKCQFPKLLFLGKDRDDYIRALHHGNNERYSKMVSIFAKVIRRQRMDLLKQNIRKVAEPMRRTGQMSLDDFVRV